MNQILIVALIVASATLVFSTQVSDCKNGVPMPLIVQVNQCDEQPCPLIQGADVVLNVTVKVTEYLEKISPEVIATAFGININYPLPERNGCQALINNQCPIAEDEIIIYKLQMPILQSYPPINLDLKFTLYNGNFDDKDKVPMFCFKVNCQVVKPSK